MREAIATGNVKKYVVASESCFGEELPHLGAQLFLLWPNHKFPP